MNNACSLFGKLPIKTVQCICHYGFRMSVGDKSWYRKLIAYIVYCSLCLLLYAAC